MLWRWAERWGRDRRRKRTMVGRATRKIGALACERGRHRYLCLCLACTSRAENRSGMGMCLTEE